MEKIFINCHLTAVVRALEDNVIKPEELDQKLLKQLMDLIATDDHWDRMS